MVKPIGYFKLWRELLSKPIWLNSTNEQKIILITLLAMANFNEKEWEWKGGKYKVEKGQFITSASSIIENCGQGITRQNVRTALKRFEKFEFLTYESTKKGMLINIVNWGLYQGNGDEPNQVTNQDLTKNQPRHNQDLTTKEERKKDKKEKKVDTYTEIVDYLNQKLGTNYRPSTKNTQSLIDARLANDFTVEDFKKVIDIKAEEWLNTDQAKFLRPETLFGNKFESYLNQIPTTKQNGRTIKIADF